METDNTDNKVTKIKKINKTADRQKYMKEYNKQYYIKNREHIIDLVTKKKHCEICDIMVSKHFKHCKTEKHNKLFYLHKIKDLLQKNDINVDINIKGIQLIK